MILRVRPLQFEFRALDAMGFPPGTAANTFRGAFGEIFRRVASPADYERMFAPRASGECGPTGFADRPRPFVLRAVSLDGRAFAPGERFALRINMFDPEIPALEYFRAAFTELGEEGLGPGRPRVELMAADELPPVELNLSFSPSVSPVNRAHVRFLTPTELKTGGKTLREPRFDALFKRARDRLVGLAALYQAAGPDPIDFRGMGARAEAVRMVSGRFEQHCYQRHSTRTGQRHGLGGFTGEALYEGDLAEFMPYLEALYWTGVGRLTVWGNGMVETTSG